MILNNINSYLKNLYQPPRDSHKGQNGKLLIIGGSHLFHAASLWSLKIASRICDMVFYSSVPENNEIVQKCKEEFRDGIVVPRNELDHYIQEADSVLIGCGMNRRENPEEQQQSNENKNNQTSISLAEINRLEDEGEQTYHFTKYLLKRFPDKRFVIDAGALQELDLKWLDGLKQMPILTPHQQEFELKNLEFRIKSSKFNEVIVLKGPTDQIYSPDYGVIEIEGGVPGMTKGGTGDVLAGLAAAFYCKSDAVTSAVVASYFNKRAGEEIYKKMGNYFNASDLVEELPKTMKRELGR